MATDDQTQIPSKLLDSNGGINTGIVSSAASQLTKAEEIKPAVDYSRNYSSFAGARYIIECGIKLEASAVTIATAATYYHRFYKDAQLEYYDPYLIGCTCIYLASKVEDDDIKIRDIINVGTACLQRGEPPLELDPYFNIRDSILQVELLLMRFLGFELKVDLPHRYLLHYLDALEDWLNPEVFDTFPIVQTAWTLLLDSYHIPLVLHVSPQLISAAVINLTLTCYGIIVPGCDELHEKPWYLALHPDCTASSVWHVTHDLVKAYELEKELCLVDENATSNTDNADEKL